MEKDTHYGNYVSMLVELCKVNNTIKKVRVFKKNTFVVGCTFVSLAELPCDLPSVIVVIEKGSMELYNLRSDVAFILNTMKGTLHGSTTK